MVDTDIGLRNLDVVMGLENRIIYDLVDVAEGRCRLPQALIKDKRFDELYLLPAAQTKDKHAVSPEQVRDIILELKKDFEFVIIDCPAGMNKALRMPLLEQTKQSLLQHRKTRLYVMLTALLVC